MRSDLRALPQENSLPWVSLPRRSWGLFCKRDWRTEWLSHLRNLRASVQDPLTVVYGTLAFLIVYGLFCKLLSEFVVIWENGPGKMACWKHRYPIIWWHWEAQWLSYDLCSHKELAHASVSSPCDYVSNPINTHNSRDVEVEGSYWGKRRVSEGVNGDKRE